MKPSSPFASAAFGLLSFGVSEAQVHLPFTRRIHDLATIFGRESNPAETLHGGDYVYVVNATFGTPGQNVALVISPTSPDTWVPDSSICLHSPWGPSYYQNDDPSMVAEVCAWGSYNTSLSATHRRPSYKYQDWAAWQPGGTYVSGVNVTDTITLGDIEVDDFIFFVASYARELIGVLGLGSSLLPDNSGGYAHYGGVYANFPERLLQQGLIATEAYSIWLDDEAGESGSLLLGAIDTARFEGKLTRLDSYSPFAGAFGVVVASINASAHSWTSSMLNEAPFHVSIGHGQTFSNLPDPTAKAIWSMAGATYNSTIRLATVPCDAASATGQVAGSLFKIQFGGTDGPLLDIHLADLILPQAVATYAWIDETNSLAVPRAPPGICLFAVQSVSATNPYLSDRNGQYNIGASLLRRAYVAFDIIHNEVAIAPVKFGTNVVSAVVAFESYGATVPQATKYCSNGSDCDENRDGDGSSDNPGVVIGLSVAFGLLTLVGALATFAVWRKACCGLRDKSGKEVDTEADTDTGEPSTTRALPIPGNAGNQAVSTLPTVRKVMTEASDTAPRVRPHIAPMTEDVGVSQTGEMSTTPGTSMHDGKDPNINLAGPSTSILDKRKGKDTGLASKTDGEREKD